MTTTSADAPPPGTTARIMAGTSRTALTFVVAFTVILTFVDLGAALVVGAVSGGYPDSAADPQNGVDATTQLMRLALMPLAVGVVVLARRWIGTPLTLGITGALVAVQLLGTIAAINQV